MRHFSWASLVTSLVVLPACSPAAEGIDAPTSDSGDLDAPLDVPALDGSALDAPGASDVPASDVPPAGDVQSADVPEAPLEPNCDPSDVVCDGLPPACAEGEAPTVESGCWGECIRAMDCACRTFDDCPPITGWSEVCYTAGHCGPAL